MTLKLAGVEDTKNHEKLTKQLQLQSSQSDDSQVGLEEYIAHQKKNQKQIYFISGTGMEVKYLSKIPFVEKTWPRRDWRFRNEAVKLGETLLKLIALPGTSQKKPPSIILKIQKNAPALSQSSNHSDDVMVRTKPDSENHQNDLNHVETTVSHLDGMVRTKPNIEHNEYNNTQTNHKRKLTQFQRQHIHDSKQIMSYLCHSNKAYKNFPTILIDKKSANCSWLKLLSINTLPHPYLLIDKTNKPFLPVIIYEITPFELSSGHSQILKDHLMKLMALSQNRKEVKTNKQVLG
ncbi:hypothetical protein O181_000278 [Austropuccinia psidii MF-1]|uniref:Uncharacterized protein n=1 Tax=Austropuccinia psidii MF-1 TaxID=1389203 RepID=A0A9Q3B8A0_9BASI|nr:hypothetical protein [Austropuccinia psidii MF-1]